MRKTKLKRADADLFMLRGEAKVLERLLGELEAGITPTPNRHRPEHRPHQGDRERRRRLKKMET